MKMQEQWLRPLLNLPPKEAEYYWFDLFISFDLSHLEQKLKTGCRFKLFKGDTVDALPNVVENLPEMDLIFRYR